MPCDHANCYDSIVDDGCRARLEEVVLRLDRVMGAMQPAHAQGLPLAVAESAQPHASLPAHDANGEAAAAAMRNLAAQALNDQHAAWQCI